MPVFISHRTLFLMLSMCALAITGWAQIDNQAFPSDSANLQSPFDPSKPDNVVKRLFDAAIADDPTMLSGLCDTIFQNDKDMDCICALAGDFEPRTPFPEGINPLSWEEFKTLFAKGATKGIPNVRGNAAVVDIYFGKTGTRQARIHLNRKGNTWYLFSI